MKNVNKILVSFFIVLLGAVFFPVNAQYDTQLIQPEYRDGGEVYGIDIGPSEKVTFFPEGCESIDKITLEAKEAIQGEIFVQALSENPQPDTEELDNVFEYCQVELRGIDEDKLEQVDVEVKVRKIWLDENELAEDQISLFTFNNDNAWNRQSTAIKTESSIYYFYETEAENFPHWAVGHNDDGLFGFFGNISPGLILLCCIILLILFILAALIIASRRRGQVQSS
ncbi:MAG: PGF-pre-PGF domain-containing protein [Candidatus Dojkabacteria bacterium]